MSKIGLIIKREYVTRVRKRSFVILSMLGPLIFGGIFLAPILLARSHSESRRIVVVDATHLFCGNSFKDDGNIHYDFSYCNFDSLQVEKIFKDSAHVSVLVIPVTSDNSGSSGDLEQVFLHSKNDPGQEVISNISSQMNSMLEKAKLIKQNFPPTLVEQVKTNITVRSSVSGKWTSSDYNIGLGYAFGMLIYLFILLYSVQVMRGVMEEKVNRIVEIIISSVRPFQLMVGKVIGVGLVGLTQFLIWIVMSTAIYSVGTNYLQNKLTTATPAKDRQEMTLKQGLPQQPMGMPGIKDPKNEALNSLNSFDDSMRSTNWALMLSVFVFYFLGGYLLYSSLFAAIGSAIDQETETQQFMFPVTAPLLLSVILMSNTITDPHGTLAVFTSIFPLTAPIVMMARLPFGISIWELLPSMIILILSIIGTMWLAGRIYRVGLLMYGKKVTYKELGKWLFYK